MACCLVSASCCFLLGFAFLRLLRCASGLIEAVVLTETKTTLAISFLCRRPRASYAR